MQNNTNNIKDLEDEEDLSKQLLGMLENSLKLSKEKNKLTKETVDLHNQLLGKVKGEHDIEDQLIELDKAIIKLKQQQNTKNSEGVKELIKQYENTKKLIKSLHNINDIQGKIKEAIHDSKEEIYETVGASEELYKMLITAGGLAAITWKAFSESLEQAKEGLTEVAKESFHLTHSMGLSYGNSVKFSAELTKARFSMTRLLYGSEETNEAAMALAEQYGNINMATDDMIQSVTQLNALTGLGAENAVDMALFFKNAGVEVSHIKSIMKDIAEKEGVSVSMLSKEFMENEELLIGATESELKLLAQRSARLVREGKTRKDILDSAKSLMNVENLINESNKIRLLTGKQLNVSELMSAATQARTAEGAENKVRAEERLNKLLQEEINKFGGVANMSQVVLEGLESSTGKSKEQLENIEKMAISYKAVGDEVKKSNVLESIAITLGGGLAETTAGITAGLMKMVAQALLFAFFMGAPILTPLKSVLGLVTILAGKIANLVKSMLGIKSAQSAVAAAGTTATAAPLAGGAAATLAGGGATPLAEKGTRSAQAMNQNRGPRGRFSGGFKPPPTPPTPPTPTPSGAGPAAGPAKAMGGINATSLMKGAAALLLMAAALYVLGKAIQLFTGDDILGGLLNAVIALTVFTAAMFGLGALIAGPGAAIFGAGVAGFLMLGAALIVLGAGLQSIAQSLQIFSQLPATFAFVEGLSTLTAKLAEFAIVGLLAAPAMLLVSKFGADITGGSSETTTSNTKQSDPLIGAIEKLGKDIREQPIYVVLNNKIVGDINRASRAINSYVNK
jgi:hypothetical protein